MINYNTIKSWSKSLKRKIPTLIALSPANDPFYTGSKTDIKRAEWFADVWTKFSQSVNQTEGIHLRRIHYWLVSQDPPSKRPDGKTYINTESDWAYMTVSSKYARYLGLVSPYAFEDHRNPEPIILTNWKEAGDNFYYNPTPNVILNENDNFDPLYYSLPDIPELGELNESLPDLPNFIVSGYTGIQQDYHIEIWCEKTTMNDVLLPHCRKYNVNLITGAGEMSITAIVDFLQRVKKANRPARIFYMSDYDLKGRDMPVSVSRKVEFYQRNDGYDCLDIKLIPIVLSGEQVSKYKLPRIPSKGKGKQNWEKAHGKGVVELDALEAIYPGELSRIVDEAILQYYDPTLTRRANQAKWELAQLLEVEREKLIASYQNEIDQINHDYEELTEDFEAVREEFHRMASTFNVKMETYQDRLNDILSRGKELYSEIADQLDQVEVDIIELPTPNLPAENDNYLYDSNREYLDQMRAYKEYQRRLGE